MELRKLGYTLDRKDYTLPNSTLLEDWINPEHLLNKGENWLKADPFEHCTVNNFFKEDVIQALRKDCEEIDPKVFKTHPDWGYKYADVSNINFLRFVFSSSFKDFLNSKLSFSFERSKAYFHPQVYMFDTLRGKIGVHNDDVIDFPRDFGLIIYLHDKWESRFGGELQFFAKENLQEAYLTIPPTPNTIVGFRISPISYHSVKPSVCSWKRMTIVVDWDFI